MATIEIRKKSASVWTHTPSDFEKFIQSRFRCKVVGDYFRVVEFGGRQLAEYHYSDVTVYDDTQGGGAETFSSGEELMLRLESLEYPAFTQGSGGGGIGFQPVVVNPQNGQTLIYSDGQWINGFLDLNGNRFITVQEIPPIVNGEITLPEGFVWVINTNTYFNANDEVFEIEEATAGFYRTDIIVAQASETQPFVYIQGVESEDTAVPPTVPDNTLLVTSISVFGDQIGEPTSPIDGSEFIKKTSEQWASYVLTGVGGLPILPQINENNRNINITGNPSGLSSLGGFVASGGASIANFWDGMTAKVLNSTPNNQTIKHNYSEADIKYLFPNEEDYIIRPNEVVYFDLKGGNLVFRYSTFLDAKNVFFDDTTTQLGETNVQSIIESIVRRGILKLEENLVFEVGYDKQFTSVSSAIDKALEYYPNEDYKITILIDEGFEIEEYFHYQGLDFSHIILSSTGNIVLTTAPEPNPTDGVRSLFFFNSCWLPSFQDFKVIKSDSLTTEAITCLKTFSCSSGYLSNTEWLKFTTCLWFEQTSNFFIQNTTVKPFRFGVYRRGVRMQNSHIDIRSINIDTYPEDPYYDNNDNVAIECLSSSTLHIRELGGTTNINGSFKLGMNISSGGQITVTSLTEFNIEGEYDVRLNGGIFYNNITASIGNNITVTIPYNTITELGLALKSTKPVPYKFNGTDYILDYIKAPSGQEYNVTVDDTGKLKSEAIKNINLFIQYSESSVLGDSGTNLIQPDLGLPILEFDDLQEDSSYSGELVLNIENNNTATAKVIELFGAEVYNNTNPSADITTKISFTLDFFNQVGDDIDYKLSWEYLSSGEVLFGEHTGTIDNTSNVDFELLVTGHSIDSFNLKKARLWRN